MRIVVRASRGKNQKSHCEKSLLLLVMKFLGGQITIQQRYPLFLVSLPNNKVLKRYHLKPPYHVFAPWAP